MRTASKLEAVTENTIRTEPQAIIELAKDGAVIGANERILKTLNYTLAEIQGKPLKDLCPEEVSFSQPESFEPREIKFLSKGSGPIGS